MLSMPLMHADAILRTPMITVICGMQWLPPYIVHKAGKFSDEVLLMACEGYRLRLIDELLFQGADRRVESGLGVPDAS
jgi:hypothetical protein